LGRHRFQSNAKYRVSFRQGVITSIQRVSSGSKSTLLHSMVDGHKTGLIDCTSGTLQ